MRVVARVVALLCFAKVRASFREFVHELEREVSVRGVWGRMLEIRGVYFSLSERETETERGREGL